ncbi:MAG: hypothetical protein R3321_13805 [Nitrososphaeraceae archaeon]|nr:hypothetical protein [Nitrososphaeraceae archaeon]
MNKKRKKQIARHNKTNKKRARKKAKRAKILKSRSKSPNKRNAKLEAFIKQLAAQKAQAVQAPQPSTDKDKGEGYL